MDRANASYPLFDPLHLAKRCTHCTSAPRAARRYCSPVLKSGNSPLLGINQKFVLINTVITTHPFDPRLPSETGLSTGNLVPTTTSQAHSVRVMEGLGLMGLGDYPFLMPGLGPVSMSEVTPTSGICELQSGNVPWPR